MNDGYFYNAGIDIIATTIPDNYIDLRDLANIYSDYDVDRVIKGTGVRRVSVVDNNTTSSDLCIQAAKDIFRDNNISPNDIDGIVFITETADYIIPHTAAIIQDKLGISQKAMTFDMHFGCPGYVYGLFQAYMLIETGFCQNVLLCAGDTVSKLVNPLDRALRMVIGDAGSATIISKRQTKSTFSFFTDGSGFKNLIVEAGGFRQPVIKGLTDVLNYDADGNARTKENLYMNGMEIMLFALREVKKLLIDVEDKMEWKTEDVDLFAMHQANEIILKRIAKQIKVDESKMPISMADTGNTGFVSIPLMLSNLFSNKDNSKLEKVIMCGFGAGLAAAAAAIDLHSTKIMHTSLYKEDH